MPAYNERVLIVDDDDGLRTAVAKALQRAGFQVAEAHCASEAIAASRESPPALILLDLGMPAVDGFDTAYVLRREPSSRNAVIVAFSGNVVIEDRPRLARLGFDDILAKPIDIHELTRRVEDLLSRRTSTVQH